MNEVIYIHEIMWEDREIIIPHPGNPAVRCSVHCKEHGNKGFQCAAKVKSKIVGVVLNNTPTGLRGGLLFGEQLNEHEKWLSLCDFSDKYFHDEVGERQQKQLKRDKEKMLIVAQWESENNLSSLSGSEKQVAWGADVRRKRWPQIQDIISRLPGKDLDKFEEWIMSKTNASWWIDNRHDYYDFWKVYQRELVMQLPIDLPIGVKEVSVFG